METVWQLHVDVNAWPSWQSEITAAQSEGPLAPGVSFDWTSYGFSVTSTVYDLVERARVLWGGTSDGITGVPRVALQRDAGRRACDDDRILRRRTCRG